MIPYRIHRLVPRLLILLALDPRVSAGAVQVDFVAAASPAVAVEGRCVRTPAGGLRLGFPGQVLHLRVSGDSVSMQVNASSAEVFFDVQVDGAEPVRLRCHAGVGEYPLLEGAAKGKHTVIITRRTESWQGTCEVLGFKTGSGTTLLQPPALPKRKLMFIGDSITCGAATDIRPNDPLKGKTAHEDQQSNARLSYGMILSRRLNAQVCLVSYGGRGVIRDWQGLNTVCNAPQFYERALPDDAAAVWNPADYVPDVIVICLGTNDFNQGVPDEHDFVNAFVAFVGKIRRDAPKARIFLADSPMLEDAPGKPAKRTILHDYLLKTIAALNDPAVSLAPVRHYPGVPNNGHPTREDHEAIAGELEPLIQQALNWN
ncbi:MAG: SGNH/GDSL hydrolase family protein [Verrucomicrobiota bacterium]